MLKLLDVELRPQDATPLGDLRVMLGEYLVQASQLLHLIFEELKGNKRAHAIEKPFFCVSVREVIHGSYIDTI